MNIIQSFLEKGILISPKIAENPFLIAQLSKLSEKDLENVLFLDQSFLQEHNLFAETNSKTELPPQPSAQEEKGTGKNSKGNVKITFSYDKEPGKISVSDFVAHFNRRFEMLSSLLRQRQELQKVTSINRLQGKSSRENVAVMGLVYNKSITKNNNTLITLEDPTGKIKVLISDKKKELFETAKEVVLDELIGVEGVIAGQFILANQLFLPDVPLIKELKKSPEEEYIALIGDPHFGSKVFLKKEFDEFIEWINQKKGSPEQKEIASKTKYLIIIGDLVEGVGVYPNQEEDLEIKDIQEQYERFADYLKKIPLHITIIICPGNHDIGRLSEPQPPLLHKYAESLKLPNVILLSNPASINIGAIDNFQGFDVLLYHGYSLIYYANNVDTIRHRGGQKRPDLLMKLLLQMRHLAPTHTSNLYTPDASFDPLVISKIPDLFITGHIHRVSVSNYKNITLLNCSCWSDITEDQEKRGLQPQPARVSLVNLKTREVKVINFFREEKQQEAISEAKQEKMLI